MGEGAGLPRGARGRRRLGPGRWQVRARLERFTSRLSSSSCATPRPRLRAPRQAPSERERDRHGQPPPDPPLRVERTGARRSPGRLLPRAWQGIYVLGVRPHTGRAWREAFTKIERQIEQSERYEEQGGELHQREDPRAIQLVLESVRPGQISTASKYSAATSGSSQTSPSTDHALTDVVSSLTWGVRRDSPPRRWADSSTALDSASRPPSPSSPRSPSARRGWEPRRSAGTACGVASAACHRGERLAVREHLGHRHLGLDHRHTAAGSIPCSCPRRELRSPLTAPTASSGTVTSTSMIGSSSTGPALLVGLLEGHRAGDLEGHLGGVDGVVRAVDE